MPVQHLASLGVGGAPYLLDDEFTDTRAAGAVNGTPAEPGPGGNRYVNDTGNTVSIAGGELVLAAPTAAVTVRWDDTIFTVRVPGRILLMNRIIKTVGIGEQGGFGWHNAATTISTRTGAFGGFVSLAQYSLSIGGTGIYAPLAGLIVNDVVNAAFVQRAVGGFWFSRKNGIGNWLMDFVNSSDATVNLRTAIGQRNIAANPQNFDRVHIPQSLYIPSLWYDSFTRADGALGSSETTGPDGQATPATAWVNQTGTIGVTGNAAQATALAGGLALATIPTTYADVHVRAALTRAAGNIGINARFQDTDNYLRAYHDGTNVVCQQVVAGTPTTLRTGAAAFVASAYIYLIVRGTTGWLFYNNVAIGASFTVPSSTQTAHGLYTTDLGNTVQAIEMWPDGGGGEHAALELM